MFRFKSFKLASFFLAGLLLFPILALAATITVPDGDPLASLVTLITTFKAGGALAIGSGVIVVAVQALKKYLPDFKAKPLIVVALGCVYGVILSIANGHLSLLDSLVAVLLSSGGAVAIYELGLKPILGVASPPSG